MLFMYVYVVYIIFIACCQNLMILFNVVYFVFAAFLLDTLFGSCFIYFSKMFVNWYSRTGGRVEILCKFFFQWFLHSCMEINTWQGANSISIHIVVCVYVLTVPNDLLFSTIAKLKKTAKADPLLTSQ